VELNRETDVEDISCESTELSEEKADSGCPVWLLLEMLGVLESTVAEDMVELEAGDLISTVVVGVEIVDAKALDRDWLCWKLGGEE